MDRTSRAAGLVVHVPHAATAIGRFREQFVLPGADLRREVLALTDRLTDVLARAIAPPRHIARFRWSRLVVDVERFRSDADEAMAARGMGAVYERTHDGRPLRRPLSADERAALLGLYDAHHARLAGLVDTQVRRHGACLLLDLHSFASKPLPCDRDQRPDRPDICLGTDAYHTPPGLVTAARSAFQAVGWSVEVDRPYAGALVPAPHLRRDPRVRALMVEVNRSLYMDERTGRRLAAFDDVCGRVAAAVRGLEAAGDR